MWVYGLIVIKKKTEVLRKVAVYVTSIAQGEHIQQNRTMLPNLLANLLAKTHIHPVCVSIIEIRLFVGKVYFWEYR